MELKTMNLSESALPQATGLVERPAYVRMFAMAGNLYCRWFHKSISRPVGGKYRCWKCLREFDMDW
jgi:hypothetical protein